jgi:hypothetical protein
MRGALLHRIALGAVIPMCDGGVARFRFRTGATVFGTNYDWAPEISKAEQMRFGVGLELELEYAVIASRWVGLRVGLESARAKYRTSELPLMLTIGGRLHINDALWVGIDVWHRRPSADETPLCNDVAAANCYAPITGVMAGVGLEGRKGATVASIEAGIAAVLFLVALVIVPG